MVATPERQSIMPQALNELQSKKQWVCWCYESDKNSRMTKVPYNAYNGYKASSTNPKHWATYEEALQAQSLRCNADGKAYDGIGFVFNNDYTGIDWDHCVNADGTIELWAQEYIDQVGTYCEFSPSHTGIHGIARALLPEIVNAKGETTRPGKKVGLTGKNHPQSAEEIYCQGRFFTMTGNHVPGTPLTIEDRQEEVTALYQELLQFSEKFTSQHREPQQTKKASTHPIDISDIQLIEKASNAANGTLFAALWRGDTSGYLSQSEADQALCNLLAFWTAKDTHRIDRLFRLSGLYREDKWERNARSGQTYGQGTIERAIASCREAYTPVNYHKEPSHLFDEIQEHLREDAENDQKEKGLPLFIIEGQLRTQVKQALEVLKMKNELGMRVFVYLSTISKVEYDEKGDPIIMQLDKAALRNELSDAADFKAWKKVGKENILVDAHPPKDLAEQLLALAPRRWGLPPLKSIVEAPVLRPDGSVLNEPGYDKKTGLYYIPSAGMDRCQIPENPSQEDAIAAMSRIKALFVNFPFEQDADYANTIALLFTPFVRYAVKRDIQMALIDATNAGTGKGLITTVVSIAATGRSTTPISAKQNDEEWRKAIFAELLRAPRIVIIDNIRGTLESATLELMLTGNGLNERILGQSKSASPKNEATWIATGNNLMIGGDLSRRCYRIRLISQTATPEERDDFSIKDLEQHVLDTRPEIVSDILTVACAWYATGKNPAKNVPNLGTFTDWAKTVGGMLEYAGVEGFQANRVELRSKNNEEALEWEAFFLTWLDEFGNNWKAASDVANKIKGIDDQSPANLLGTPANPLGSALPQCLKAALADKPKTLHIKLGDELAKRVQTVYGYPGLRVEKEWDRHRKGWSWRVMRVIAGVPTPQSEFQRDSESSEKEVQEGKANDTTPSANSNFSENLNGLFDHPQSPATLERAQLPDSQYTVSNGSTSRLKPIQEETAKNHFAGVAENFAGVAENKSSQPSAIYPKGQIPSEYQSLFSDYKNEVMNGTRDEMEWNAPAAGVKLPGLLKRRPHIDYTTALLKSGDAYRVSASVEAMKQIVEVR